MTLENKKPINISRRTSIIILIACIIVLVIVFKRPIMRSSCAPPQLRLLLRLFVPPADLNDLLVNEELDISKKGVVKEFEFKNKYLGNHDAGIILGKFTSDLYYVPSEKRYKLKLIMEISFYTDNRLILSRIIEKVYDPFVGGPNRSGFSFVHYKCPEDLPVNKKIIFKVKVIEPDEYLAAHYGPVKFYVAKGSDL